MRKKSFIVCSLVICSFLSDLRAEDGLGTLDVACNLPMTGPLGIYGHAIEEGVGIALGEDLDSSKLLKFSYDDNESKTMSAVTVANKQFGSSPDIYVSGLKPQYMAIKDMVQKQVGLPHFAWVFDVNVRPKGEKNTFRTFLSFKHEPRIFIEYAKELKAKRVAIVYVTLPSTDEEFLEIVKPGLKEAGVEDIYIQSYQLDLADFGGLALNVRKYKPDLLIVSGFVDNFIAMFRRLYEQGLIQDKNVMAGYDLIDVVGQVRPEWIENVKVAAPLFLTRRESDPKVKGWFENFKKKYNKDPNYTNAYAYDMAKIFLEASKIKNTSPEKGLTEIIQNIDIDGLTSRLKFDEEGSLPLSIERAVVRDGNLVRDR